MSASYLNIHLTPGYAATSQTEFRLSPGDGFEGLQFAPLVLSAMRTVAAVVALVACVHAGLWVLMRENVRAPNFDGQLASVSYAPFEGSSHPDAGGKARVAQIRADLKTLAPLTRAVRTYSATGGVELV